MNGRVTKMEAERLGRRVLAMAEALTKLDGTEEATEAYRVAALAAFDALPLPLRDELREAARASGIQRAIDKTFRDDEKAWARAGASSWRAPE